MAVIPATSPPLTAVPSTASSAPSASALPTTVPPSALAPSPSTGTSARPATSPSLPTSPDTVPILYYHRVEAVPTDFRSWPKARRNAFLQYDTLPGAFRAQLDWLVEHGYTTILPRDLAAHWDSGQPLPAKPVVLTFDDGFPSWVTEVLPALAERGMAAEFYLTLDAIRNGAIRWSDVAALSAAGNGIGGHDVHHVQLAGLPGGRHASAAEMWKEVHDIRAVIESHVGLPPDSMAYVGGGEDATLVDLVKKAGYTTARSIRRGIVQSAADRYLLRVVRIGAHDDVVDPVTEQLANGLPTFTARMRGVSDLTR